MNESGITVEFTRISVSTCIDQLIFTLDEEILGTITPPSGGFYELGNFTGPTLWDKDKMSPFNQPVRYWFHKSLSIETDLLHNM